MCLGVLNDSQNMTRYCICVQGAVTGEVENFYRGFEESMCFNVW